MQSSVGLSAPPPMTALMSGGPLSVFLDFDGTLVDLAPTPDAIRPAEGLTQSVTHLSIRLEGRCAMVSGRPVDELQHYLKDLPVGWAGSHGFDVRAPNGATIGTAPMGLPDSLEEALRSFAQDHGVDYEAKPHGGALHYRRNPEQAEQAVAFAEQLAADHGWKAQRGKCVVELVAEGADKGTAVFDFMREAPFAGSRPYFLGDDLTDEAGFRACAQLGGAGVIVGDRAAAGVDTLAQYALPDVASVHEWLEL